MVRYEWDEEKRRANLVKHGLDFADVEGGFDWDTAVFRDDDVVDNELRQRVIGWLNGRLVAALVYVERESVTRIVSLRPATRYERRLHGKRLWHS